MAEFPNGEKELQPMRRLILTQCKNVESLKDGTQVYATPREFQKALISFIKGSNKDGETLLDESLLRSFNPESEFFTVQEDTING